MTPVGADDADEQNTPDPRRGRFIAPIADLSASRGRSAIQINELNDKKKLLIRKQ
jgi:hypothetical protein